MNENVSKESQERYWLESATHDLEAAEALFSSGRNDWCLFIGHLVIEKTIKALVVRRTGLNPPRTHNLVTLAETAGLALSEEQRHLLLEITDFNIETRYPDYKQSFYGICTREFAEKYFTEIKKVRSWLLSQMKQ